jgi:hypothetical protein
MGDALNILLAAVAWLACTAIFYRCAMRVGEYSIGKFLDHSSQSISFFHRGSVARRSVVVVKGTSIIISSIAVVAGAAWWAIENRPADRDPDTLCAPALETGHTIVLVDKTDRWTELEADRLEAHIWWLASTRVKVEERLSIFVFDDRFERGTKPVFSVCKPPSAKDVNNIIESKQIYEKLYRRQFVEPLRSVLADVKQASTAPCSPIAEVLVDILTRREIVDAHGSTQVMIISDMAENSTLYSVYARTTCFTPRTSKAHDDTTKIDKFLRDNKTKINPDRTSFIVYQTALPSPPQGLSEMIRERWKEFFRILGVVPEWNYF